MRTSASQGNKRADLDRIRPACWQGFERTLFVIEKHAVLAPSSAYCQQFVATPVLWMERMGDFDNLPLTNITGCSR